MEPFGPHDSGRHRDVIDNAARTAELFITLARLFRDHIAAHPFSEYQWLLLTCLMSRDRDLCLQPVSFFDLEQYAKGVYGSEYNGARLRTVLKDQLFKEAVVKINPQSRCEDSLFTVTEAFQAKWNDYIEKVFATLLDFCYNYNGSCLQENFHSEDLTPEKCARAAQLYFQFIETFGKYYRCALTEHLGSIVHGGVVNREATRLRTATTWMALMHVHFVTTRLERWERLEMPTRSETKAQVQRYFSIRDRDLNQELDCLVHLSILVESPSNRGAGEDAFCRLGFEFRSQFDTMFEGIAWQAQDTARKFCEILQP